MTATSRVLLAVVLALPLALATPASSSIEPRLYMAWHAPYGSPRATSNVTMTCGDGGADTLYLTFETGVDTTQFVGLECSVFVRPQGGDTLSDHWRNLDSGIETQFLADSIPGYPRPWRGSLSMNFSFFDVVNGMCRLQLSHMRPPQRAVAVRDSVPYLYARVLFPHPPAGGPRCGQPLCFQWAMGQFIMDSTASSSVYGTMRDPSFVSWNSPGGAVCGAFKPVQAGKKPEPWKPAKAGKKTR